METTRCDCEHLNCELGSLRYPPHHKAGGHGMSVRLCVPCLKRVEETNAEPLIKA